MENKNLPTLNLDDGKVIATLKATIAKDLTSEEFDLFREICRGTGLNPFKREIWAIKSKGYINKRGEQVDGKLQIMTGINGFYEIANNDVNFDGIESGLVGPMGDLVNQAYPKQDWIGAWARVHLKTRKVPVEYCVMRDECDQSRLDPYYPERGIWRVRPRIMTMKCAEALALRKALPQKLNFLYVEEEILESSQSEAIKIETIAPKAIGGPFYYSGRSLSPDRQPKFDEYMRKKNAIKFADGVWKSSEEIKSKEAAAQLISEAEAFELAVVVEADDMEKEAASNG